MDTAIEVKGLSKHYSGFSLQDISFCLPRGGIMGFIGANGAGKTTTIKALLNLINIDSGEINLLGHMRGEKEVKQKLGVVLDENNAYDNLSFNQAARVESTMRADWDDTLWQYYVKRFQLPARQKVQEYSRGMKMKLFIALALAHKPQLLLLDEPTSGLDPLMREEMLSVFTEFIQDKQHAILLSSHITSDLDKIATHVTFIHEGRLIFSRAKSDIMEDWRLTCCAKAEFDKIPQEFIFAYRNSSFGYEVLVKDSLRLAQILPQLAFNNVSIEEIMLFFVHGQRGYE
ncbi:MAG: ABC transporter ATP-binding protein [Firmicutes bacterium]|nr:ABC transporter ATP-binding protein [Bacillota bacterium]